MWGIPRTPARLEMISMLPFLFVISGNASIIGRATPTIFTPIMESTTPGERSEKLPRIIRPALHTSTSIPPNFSTAPTISRVTSSGSRISPATARLFSPAGSSDSLAASRGSLCLAFNTTRPPRLRKRAAVSYPIPRLEPVTIITFPSNPPLRSLISISPDSRYRQTSCTLRR